MLFIPLSTESEITGNLNLNLCLSIPFLLFDNITLTKQSSFIETIDVPLGIKETDIRRFMSSFLPEIYDETSVAIDLGASFKHSQLVLDLAPILLLDQSMLLNFTSSEFQQNEVVVLNSAENKISTLEITNGTIYNQLQGNLTGNGLLQTNSSLQPKLYFKADLLGKTIVIPLPVESSFNFPVSSHDLNGTLITKSILIPTYFIDKDTTSPTIFQFPNFWHIEELDASNTLELLLIETQSGIKRIDVYVSDVQISHMVNNNTILLEFVQFERFSERTLSGTVLIEIEDNKGNTNSYEIYVYHNLPDTPPTLPDNKTNLVGYIVFVGFVIIAVIFIFYPKKNS